MDKWGNAFDFTEYDKLERECMREIIAYKREMDYTVEEYYNRFKVRI